MKKILITGGKGQIAWDCSQVLGKSFQLSCLGHEEMDISKAEIVEGMLKSIKPDILVNCAAYTLVDACETHRKIATLVNHRGPENLAQACKKNKIWLIHLSTDYVFKGDRGNYGEDDPVYPVNKYAWSKLGGECAVRLYDNSLIIRTSFGPNVFPYEKAFMDQWTSRESVRVIAEKIVKLLDKNIRGVLHVGGESRTVLEYAIGLDPAREIGELSINEVSFQAPVDTSLDCSRYKLLFSDKEGA